MSDNSTNRIAPVYSTFAEREAHGRVVVYVKNRIAGDSVALSFLAKFPRAKQQPNLFVAAMKYLYGAPGNWGDFRALLLEHGDEIRATMMARNTETNEPARCATPLPLLARLRPPLALPEVGNVSCLDRRTRSQALSSLQNARDWKFELSYYDPSWPAGYRAEISQLSVSCRWRWPSSTSAAYPSRDGGCTNLRGSLHPQGKMNKDSTSDLMGIGEQATPTSLLERISNTKRVRPLE
jgi:hypothetical protein